MFIPLTAFSPDADPTASGVIQSATNLVPTLRGYAGAPSAQSIGLPALAAAATGGAVCIKLDNSKRIFSGTATALYEASSSAWSSVTRGTGAYSAGNTRWRFSQFGDTSLATQKGDTLQYSNSGAFADITGAPKANCIATASGFVMLGDTSDGTYGDSPDRWWCSAINDATSGAAWTPSVTTQCTTGRLVDTPGRITGMVGMGSDFIAYKDRSMYYGTYVGAPAVWQWRLIPGDVGAPSQEAVVNIKTAHVFMGYEDFYLFDGSRPVPIGDPIRKWFFGSRLDPSYRYNVIGTHDRTNGCVWFFYPTVGSNGVPTDAVIYSYRANKWGTATVSIECALEYFSPSVTYDGLGTLFGTWDSLPSIAYDSPFWTASIPLPAVIGTDHTVKTLSGASSTSSFVSMDFGDDDTFTTVKKARLRYAQAPTTATCTHYGTDQIGSAFTAATPVSENSGKFDLLNSNRWHKLQFDFTGDHEELGMYLDVVQDGGF